jgi:hypothetical protein
LPTRQRGKVTISSFLPDNIPGITLERLELPAGSRRETYRLATGDVVVFRGDQRHSYSNPGSKIAIGYSAVLFQRVE